MPEGVQNTRAEFYAEKDLYTVISNCPYADQALPVPEADPNPVYISVWDTGIRPADVNHLGLPGDRFWEDAVFECIAAKKRDATEPPA